MQNNFANILLFINLKSYFYRFPELILKTFWKPLKKKKLFKSLLSRLKPYQLTAIIEFMKLFNLFLMDAEPEFFQPSRKRLHWLFSPLFPHFPAPPFSPLPPPFFPSFPPLHWKMKRKHWHWEKYHHEYSVISALEVKIAIWQYLFNLTFEATLT